MAGNDFTNDDVGGFSQKMTPKVFPYKYEVIEEREFLVPVLSLDGSLYVTSKELEYRNIEFERRPVYVVRMTQLDKNYQYSKRIIYVDKENFNILLSLAYDQKGRLYRSFNRTGVSFSRLSER